MKEEQPKPYTPKEKQNQNRDAEILHRLEAQKKEADKLRRERIDEFKIVFDAKKHVRRKR